MSYIQKSYFKKFGNKDNSMESKIIEDIAYLVEKSNNPTYKVYTALLTQSGWDAPETKIDGSLTIGVTYYIDQVQDGVYGDFTNVGAPNNEVGTFFVATGNEPNSFGKTTLSYNLGAPVVTVLENTIGNIWFSYDDKGGYIINGNFPESKTVFVISNIGEVPADSISIRGYIDINNIYIATTSVNFTGNSENLNNILFNTPIEIRVYN